MTEITGITRDDWDKKLIGIAGMTGIMGMTKDDWDD